MSGVDLFDHQKQLLAELVRAVETGCRPAFTIFNNSRFIGLVFEGNGQHEHIECDPHDLHALSSAGYLKLLSRDAGTLLPRAIEAIRTNFAVPTAPAAGSVFHIQGNVGNIQSGQGSFANVQQNINPSVEDALALIGECRKLVNSSDTGHAETREALDDLEAELKNGSPKKSRVLAFLQSASKYAAAGTALAATLAQLAQAILGSCSF